MTVRLPKEIRALARQGVFRARDLAAVGVPRYRLKELVEAGALRKTGRGLYMPQSADITENHSLVQLAARCPKAVVCLLTALRFHDLTTENPEVIYVLLPKGVKRPRITSPQLDVTWASGESYLHGIEEHLMSGVKVKITSAAKTVADCFKYRNKVGTAVAAEALRDAWQKKKASSEELWQAAKVCRMTNIMRPYFEMLVA
ncbi:type IV toxin-antitoxin system AbiEi family antitoxin domain-containing protein [Prosthecobacter sp. SYSU 5D2]|uniref:type IV toxin-antitoxin system AbiEi family antitoxin domain-containing protein n=1 Tax=Prosthecobacter sp. SYSU 5D2 TaxID=3134134 RepID=UPI0031FF01FB